MCDPSEKGNLPRDLELGHAQAEGLVGGADAEETASALLYSLREKHSAWIKPSCTALTPAVNTDFTNT